MRKNRRKIAYGDFQTPLSLAKQVCAKVFSDGFQPSCVVEPTCGKGAFLKAVIQQWETPGEVWGFEINPDYLEEASSLLDMDSPHSLTLKRQDFFEAEWDSFLQERPDPLLLVGNPPWVTNSQLGQLEASNLPTKSNFQKCSGIEAITGQGNFDISEYMSLNLLQELQGRDAIFAFLLKMSTARKLLQSLWEKDTPPPVTSLYQIDAKAHFGASVDACLLVCQMKEVGKRFCRVFDSIDDKEESSQIGYSSGKLIANYQHFEFAQRFLTERDGLEWRSGVKHDCSKVLELKQKQGILFNSLGEEIEVEEDCLYPFLKSSDVAKGIVDTKRFLMLPQTSLGQDTLHLRKKCPDTWNYLCSHKEKFEVRKSKIYKGKPPFSVFGVGDYSFAPWKVAISGLYKKLNFLVVPPLGEKPALFDDTVYFTPCATEDEAVLKAELLNSDAALKFFQTFVFFGAKRPVTAQLLRKLDLKRIAKNMGRLEEWNVHCE